MVTATGYPAALRAMVGPGHQAYHTLRRTTACRTHGSSHLNRRDLKVLAGQHRHLGAAARAQRDGAGRLEVNAADPAAAQTGRLGDLQPGSLEVGALGHQVEAEPHG